MTQACIIWNCPQVYVPLHHAGRSCTHPCWASQHAPESWHTFGRRTGAYASQRDHGRCTWWEEQQPISHHFWHKHSKRSFQHPSSKLCCNWLHHSISPHLRPLKSPVYKSHAVRVELATSSLDDCGSNTVSKHAGKYQVHRPWAEKKFHLDADYFGFVNVV